MINALNSFDYISKAYADTLYCMIGGDCNLTTIHADNISVKDLTVTDNLTYETVNIIEYNVTGNMNAENLYLSGYLNASEIHARNNSKAPRYYIGANGGDTGYNFWIQERPSVANNRIMIYGAAQTGSMGYVVSPTDTIDTDMYANLWSKDVDNPAVSDFYYGGIGMFGGSGSGKTSLYSGQGGAYTAGDVTLSAGYDNDALWVDTDKNVDVYGKLRYHSYPYNYWQFTDNSIALYQELTAGSGVTGTILEAFDFTSFGIRYISLGNAFYDTDVWIQGLFKTAMMYDWGNDEFTWSSNSRQGDNIIDYYGSAKDSAIYYSTTGVDGLHIDPNLINTGDEVSIEGDLYIYSANNDDRAVSIQQDRNITTGFNTGIFMESRVTDSASASGSLSGVTSGVYKKNNGDLTSEYAMRGINSFVDLNYYSSGGDIAGATSHHNILLENSANYGGTLSKYSGTLYRTSATGGNQIDIKDFAYIRLLSSDRPGAINNSGIIVGDITGADNNFAWKSGKGNERHGNPGDVNNYTFYGDINTSGKITLPYDSYLQFSSGQKWYRNQIYSATLDYSWTYWNGSGVVTAMKIFNDDKIEMNLSAKINGDLNQKNGNATITLPYGEIYIPENNISVVSYTAQQVYVNITANITEGNINGMYLDGSNLTIIIDGLYEAGYSVSFSGLTGSTHGFNIGVNGQKQIDCYSQRKLGSTDVGNTGSGCYINLVTGDHVTLISDDEDATLNDITIVAANLRLKRIG